MKPKALALVGFFALGSSLLQAQSPTPVPLTMPGNPATDVKVVPDPYLNSGRTENQPPTSTTATIQQTAILLGPGSTTLWRVTNLDRGQGRSLVREMDGDWNSTTTFKSPLG